MESSPIPGPYGTEKSVALRGLIFFILVAAQNHLCTVPYIHDLKHLCYRDRRVERQSHWPEALFRRLATLHLFNSDPL